MLIKQGKSEGFDSCDRPSNLKLDSNHRFFSPFDLEIWWMTSKNNRALPLYYVRLCASFQIHRWIQTGVTVQERSIRVEISDILSRVTLTLDGWPWKTIGHFFYTTPALCIISNSSVMSNLSYSPETLNSGQNRQFLSRVTLKFDEWPWKTRAPLICCFKLCASFHSHWWIQTGVTVWETPNSGQNRQVFVPCDLEIWGMTLKNNRAPLLCCFKLCASFHSHWWIYTRVTVRKRSIRVKIGNFVPCDLEIWGMTLKNNTHLSYAVTSFVHHFVAILVN